MFLTSIRQWTSEPVALLLDGLSDHDLGCVDPTGQVTIFMFPPNITSLFQPLDQGVINAFKSHYKTKLLSKLNSAAPKYTNLQLNSLQDVPVSYMVILPMLVTLLSYSASSRSMGTHSAKSYSILLETCKMLATIISCSKMLSS